MTRKERRAAKAQRRRGMNVGDAIHVHHARDRKGRFCSLCGNAVHGPFASEKEMQEHSEATLLGPDAEISDGGMWDPNWDKKQSAHRCPLLTQSGHEGLGIAAVQMTVGPNSSGRKSLL
jgi:hypothetical protein